MLPPTGCDGGGKQWLVGLHPSGWTLHLPGGFFTDLVVHKVFYKIRIFFSLVFTISCELYSEKARLHLKQMTVYAVYSTTNVMIETQ